MNRQLLRFGVILAVVCASLIVMPASATAKPSLLSPGAGAQVPYASQVFTWTDDFAEGQLDHWYMEISRSPGTDYYYFGFFSGDLVYSSGHTNTASINLNAVGSALAPGTYYWHVVGYYGWLGSNGVYWSPVRSFTVQSVPSPGPVPPTIVVNPTSLTFTVAQGDTTDYTQNLDISNSGGQTMYFSAVTESQSPQWLLITNGTSTGTVYSLPVWVSAEGVSPGTRSARVRVQEPTAPPYNTLPITNAPKDVWVTLNVIASEHTPPSGAAISINAGTAQTRDSQVTLQLFASDSGSGMGEMRLSNDGVTWSQWMPYSTTKTWQLTNGSGTKTVWAQFRDKLRNESGVVSDTILLDVTDPSAALWLDTSLSLKTPSSPPAYGGSAKLSATLVSTKGLPVASKSVVFERWNGSAWASIGSAATDANGGAVVYVSAVKTKTTLRALFLESSPYRASLPATVDIKPKVRLTRSTSWGSKRKGRSYYYRGSIEPKHAKGDKNKVKFKMYKKGSDGKYRLKKTVTASYSYYSSSKTKWAAKVSFPSRGTWRVRAHHASDGSNASSYSSYDKMTVK